MKTKAINTLAKTISTLTTADDALPVLELLMADLHLAIMVEKKKRKQDLEDHQKELDENEERRNRELHTVSQFVSAFYDNDGVRHAVPDGHYMSYTLATNKVWPSTMHPENGPVYEVVQDASGAEYVDVCIYEQRESSCTFLNFEAESFLRMIENCFMVKTKKSVRFNGRNIELVRITVTHKEFHAMQTTV